MPGTGKNASGVIKDDKNVRIIIADAGCYIWATLLTLQQLYQRKSQRSKCGYIQSIVEGQVEEWNS